MSAESEESRRAFNEGCDARLRGEPLEWNSYHHSTNVCYQQWRRGWEDVNMNFGRSVRGRWRYTQLRPVPLARVR